MSPMVVIAAPQLRELTYPTKTQKGAYKGCTLQAGTYSRHKQNKLSPLARRFPHLEVYNWQVRQVPNDES